MLTSTDVVPMMTEPSRGVSAPVPIAEVMESMVPVVTGMPSAMPSSAAAAVVTEPTIPFIDSSGGSLSGSSRVAATNSESYSVRPHVRLSHTICPNIVDCVAPTTPVSRALT